jgi:putative nucleotidyltransferase with HDIG domain
VIYLLLLNHSNNVSKLSHMVGQAIGLSNEELHDLSLSAFLHDIGKLRISHEILYKPDKLSEVEFRIIKKHPSYGAKTLSSSGYNKKIVEAVLYHQERFNGSGYEKGLKGEAIPFFARIIGIADSYEAMVSKRVYAEPKSHTEACNEIEKFKGVLYDPYITNVFVDIMKNEESRLQLINSHALIDAMEVEKQFLGLMAEHVSGSKEY